MPTTPVNELQRLIRRRMSELELSFQGLADRSGIPKATLHHLASKRALGLPRTSTLDGLAKGLQVPIDVVRESASRAAGYTLGDVPTTLEAAQTTRIVAAVIPHLTSADQEKLRRLALAFLSEQEQRDILGA